MDELFSEMSREDLADWGVALVGVSCIPGRPARLSASAVRDFAIAELEQLPADDPALDLVVELATDESLSAADLRDKLARLCDIKKVDLEQSKRMWQLILFQDLLHALDQDSLYGMIALSEFWSVWDWPVDTPASLHANVELADYHSDAHYQRVVDDHRHWLARHMANVRGS